MTDPAPKFTFANARLADRAVLERFCSETFRKHVEWHPQIFTETNTKLVRKIFAPHFRRFGFLPRTVARDIIVARSGDEIAGYAVCAAPRDRLGRRKLGQSAAIYDIFVRDDCRHRGLGSMLLDRAVLHLEKLGYPEVKAVVWGKNTASQKLFSRHFEETCRVYRHKLAEEQPVVRRDWVFMLVLLFLAAWILAAVFLG